MKTRVFEHDSKVTTFFCPNCHRRLSLPIKNIVIKSKITLACSNCKNGRILIKGTGIEDVKVEEAKEEKEIVKA